MKAYAGIGARELPLSLNLEFIKIGRHLAQDKGLILRSGGAEGADTAFEDGCDDGSGQKEIFLPWKGFNHNKSALILPDPIPLEIVKIARDIYPRWNTVSESVRRLHARNVMQILGADLNDQSAFVVCYTERPYNDQAAIGGTMFGIELAEKNNVPVYNFYIRGDREKFYNEQLDGNILPQFRVVKDSPF